MEVAGGDILRKKPAAEWQYQAHRETEKQKRSSHPTFASLWIARASAKQGLTKLELGTKPFAPRSPHSSHRSTVSSSGAMARDRVAPDVPKIAMLHTSNCGHISAVFPNADRAATPRPRHGLVSLGAPF